MQSFIKDEMGQDLVEYALIIAVVGLTLVLSVNRFSIGVADLYSSMTEAIRGYGGPDTWRARIVT